MYGISQILQETQRLEYPDSHDSNGGTYVQIHAL